ncbi:MAG: hypothetical protein ACI9DK_000187 [Vicingaceae bacterium]|jgi:hypothetical protein
MKASIKALLANFGIRNKYDADRHSEYTKLKKKLEKSSSVKNTEVAKIVVFSKDRAMQLDALLRSYFHYTTNPVPVRILYHASSAEFSEGYKQLQNIFSEKQVEFVQEKKFKPDLIQLFNRLNCSKVIFMVDDLMFKRNIDFGQFTSIDTKQCVASLRLGNHLNYAYTLEEKQPLPKFEKIENLLSWSWQKAMGDWAYPLSVDGHLFDKEELEILVNELVYKAPNSFEEALQLMNPLFAKRRGLCFPTSVIVNNPCNKVQVENDNLFGEISIEQLNQKWLEGFRIEFEEHKDLKNTSAHQELRFNFVKR